MEKNQSFLTKIQNKSKLQAKLIRAAAGRKAVAQNLQGLKASKAQKQMMTAPTIFQTMSGL